MDAWVAGAKTMMVAIIILTLAFATGTSWGTNSILMPIVIPIAAAISNVGTEVTPLGIVTK